MKSREVSTVRKQLPVTDSSPIAFRYALAVRTLPDIEVVLGRKR